MAGKMEEAKAKRPAEDLDRAVFQAVRRVPRGRAVAYGVLGKVCAPPVGPRRVGLAMSRCPKGPPWHRVVGAGGRLPSLPTLGGRKLQKALLESEGIPVSDHFRVESSRMMDEAELRSRMPVRRRD